MKNPLYHGDNLKHEFWESADRALLILRNHSESSWSAHRNYGFVAFEDSAEKAAERLGATLDTSLVWQHQGGEDWKLTKPV